MPLTDTKPIARSDFESVVQVAKAVIVLLAAYLAFWLLATFAEQAAKPPGFGTHDSIVYLPLGKAGEPLPGAAPQVAGYTAPYRYISRLWDSKVTGGRTRIELPDLPADRAWGMMVSARSDILAVRLNGQEILPDIRSPRLPGAFVSEPSLYRFPANLRTEGLNTIELDVRRSLRDPIIFPDYAIGPTESLQPVFATRNIMAVEAPLIGIVLSAFSILLYVMIARPDTDRFKNLTFIGTLVLSAASSATFLFFDLTRYSLELYSYAITLFSFGLAICAMGFAYIESARRYVSRRVLTGFLLVLLPVSIAVSIANYNGMEKHFVVFNAYITAQLFSTGALVTAAALLAWEISRDGMTRLAERFLLIICFGAIALDRSGPGLFTVYSPLASDTPLSLQWMPMVGSLVGCAMVFALAKHAESARGEILSANATLERKLDERETQLREVYASREKILAEQVTAQERQRIMRDMHDGMGSNLISMLLAARRGQAEPARVAEGLQGVIDEMRLMIDSMDSVGESLGSAFAIFRERVQPRVEAAGMAFVWQDQSGQSLPDYGPRDVLQVFRIMQEAVTNALKHSGGKSLTVTLAPSPDPAFALRLAIADDGAGMGKANPRGKGLDSMAARTAGFGGKVEVATNERGVTVSLDLPPSRGEASMP
jgi:two-component system sensor histidine kinase UhpB